MQKTKETKGEKTNIIPIKDKVLIKTIPAEELEKKSLSGIIIPDTAQEKPQKGEVLAVSESDEDGNKPTVKAGDIVYYGKYAGSEMSFDDIDFLSMRESDIVGKVSKSK